MVIALLPAIGTAFTGKVKDNRLPSVPVTFSSKIASRQRLRVAAQHGDVDEFIGLVRRAIQWQQDRRLCRQHRSDARQHLQ